MDLVRMFYNLIPQRQRWAERQQELAEFIIDETFGVPGVGTVVAGEGTRGRGGALGRCMRCLIPVSLPARGFFQQNTFASFLKSLGTVGGDDCVVSWGYLW
jgi:hypothetical protein